MQHPRHYMDLSERLQLFHVCSRAGAAHDLSLLTYDTGQWVWAKVLPHMMSSVGGGSTGMTPFCALYKIWVRSGEGLHLTDHLHWQGQCLFPVSVPCLVEKRTFQYVMAESSGAPCPL